LPIFVNKYFSAYFGNYYRKVHQNEKKKATINKIFSEVKIHLLHCAYKLYAIYFILLNLDNYSFNIYYLLN